MAGGAQAARENVLAGEAGCDELRAIGGRKIEPDVFRRGLMAGRHSIEPLERIRLIAGAQFIEPLRGIGKLRSKLRDQFGADLIAAAPDRRAKCGEKVLRI